MLDRVLCLHSRWKILYAGLANGSVVSFCLKVSPVSALQVHATCILIESWIRCGWLGEPYLL